MDITSRVVAKALELGADIVGIAPAERFAGAPVRMSPEGLLPGARSVVVAALHHTDASIELSGEPTPQPEGPYHVQWRVMNPKLHDISFLLGRFLEAEGYRALPIVSSNIWRYHGYKEFKLDFAPDLAHRYAAVAAGLGEIGWSGLLLTPQFGPRQRLVSIVTDAKLTPTPVYAAGALCDRCMSCVENCPADAFRREVRGINEIVIGGRSFRFPDINKWRCAWGENFGLDLAHAIPEHVDEKVILTYLEKYGTRAGEQGNCLKFCMVPDRRYYDPSYCRAPRRKRDKARLSAKARADRISAIARRNGVEVMAIGAARDLEKACGIHAELHLPDAVSVTSVGIRSPEGGPANAEMAWTVERRVAFAAWEIAHFLDLCGDSAISHTRINDNQVARALGILRADHRYGTVLTSARMPATTRRTRGAGKLTPEGLRRLCCREGADLVGFFTVKRFNGFARAMRKHARNEGVRETVKDANAVAGRCYPEIDAESLALKAPGDWLPRARSVIVLGLHFPHVSLDTAKVTPAATVGPFAFVQFETLNLLSDIAFKIVRRLERSGYRATFTMDLAGQASRVRSSRGMLPDMRANVDAAVLAGLAYPGAHGHPITPQYGVRQRFVAIVTDCPLPDDPLCDATPACEGCNRPCIQACPTKAINATPRTVKVEGKGFNFGTVDSFACDWAKRYCLSRREGAEYMGVEVDVPLPQERTAEAVAQAVSKVDWGAQKGHLNVAEECLRACPAHRLGFKETQNAG